MATAEVDAFWRTHLIQRLGGWIWIPAFAGMSGRETAHL